MAAVVACWEVSDALCRELSQPTRINAKTTTSDVFIKFASSSLTKKAEPPPTRDVNRDSGTDRANGGWLRRLVRRLAHITNLASCRSTVPTISMKIENPISHRRPCEDRH